MSNSERSKYFIDASERGGNVGSRVRRSKSWSQQLKAIHDARSRDAKKRIKESVERGGETVGKIDIMDFSNALPITEVSRNDPRFSARGSCYPYAACGS
tara:strand:- start:870 stop:1166 length:297 start_codon:yes stop_codon:yes gene_type:complete